MFVVLASEVCIVGCVPQFTVLNMGLSAYLEFFFWDSSTPVRGHLIPLSGALKIECFGAHGRIPEFYSLPDDGLSKYMTEAPYHHSAYTMGVSVAK